jgi:hypothetical protein
VLLRCDFKTHLLKIRRFLRGSPSEPFQHEWPSFAALGAPLRIAPARRDRVPSALGRVLRRATSRSRNGGNDFKMSPLGRLSKELA